MRDLVTAENKWVSSAFNKHRRPTKSVGYFPQKSRLLFALNWSNERKIVSNPLLIQSVTLLKPAAYFNFYWDPWVSQSRNRVGSPFVLKDLHLNLQEFKLLFLFIWEPREQKMCEWSLACCGCIVAMTADCQKRRSLFFNSLTVAKFENMSFSKCATSRYMMQARLEGTDDSV